MASRYLCSWEQPNAPTRTMSDVDARAHYKAHSVRGDCAFVLRYDPGTANGQIATLAGDIIAAWANLAAACDAAGKETPAHREQRDKIRTAVRCYLGGYSYTLPAALPASAPARRKPARMSLCPHCGHQIGAAA